MNITKAQARYCRDRIGIVQTDLANIFGLKSAVTVQRLENPAIQTRPDEKNLKYTKTCTQNSSSANT
jgi:hypothetical protein